MIANSPIIVVNIKKQARVILVSIIQVLITSAIINVYLINRNRTIVINMIMKK